MTFEENEKSIAGIHTILKEPMKDWTTEAKKLTKDWIIESETDARLDKMFRETGVKLKSQRNVYRSMG